jgi:hypothetical protein
MTLGDRSSSSSFFLFAVSLSSWIFHLKAFKMKTSEDRVGSVPNRSSFLFGFYLDCLYERVFSEVPFCNSSEYRISYGIDFISRNSA